MIDERAIIHPSAKIASNVQIGPWSFIGENVEIGEGTWVGPHVVINGPTKIGKNNKIFQFASLGDAPQAVDYKNEPTLLEIGDHNTIREYAMINRGTVDGGGVTRIGNHNFIMGYVHIGHDCQVHDNVILVNCSTLAGHVTVENYAIIGAFAAAHQFCTIGAHAFVAKATYVTQDVLPYVVVDGHSPTTKGINKVGLLRRGFTPQTVEGLRQAYKTIFRKGLTIKLAIQALEPELKKFPEIQLYIDGMLRAKRGIVR